MNSPLQPSITTPLGSITPHGDYVLVRRLDPQDGLNAPADVLIARPEAEMNANGKMVRRDQSGIRRGLVVAAGPGDRLFSLICWKCNKTCPRSATARDFRCPRCSNPAQISPVENVRRCEMHVKPGDIVLYQRSPANDVVINGEDYVFLHEEQMILAVLEPEEVNA